MKRAIQYSVYWFTEGTLMKMEYGRRYESNVSLNWLLNPDCKIITPLGLGAGR